MHINELVSSVIPRRNQCGKFAKWKAVADPRFSEGGDVDSKGGRKPIILSNFPESCMEMKKSGPGACPLIVLVDPPLEICVMENIH